MFCPIDQEYVVVDPYWVVSEEEMILEMILLAVVLAAICLVLWKVFVTNRTTPRGNVLSLGLDETSATHTELYGRKIPWRTLFMYAAVGLTTFEFGVYVYETCRHVQEWLSNYY